MGRHFGDRRLCELGGTTGRTTEETARRGRAESGPDGETASAQPLDAEPAGGRSAKHNDRDPGPPVLGSPVRCGRLVQGAEVPVTRSAAKVTAPLPDENIARG